jgi:hypothetical protein
VNSPQENQPKHLGVPWFFNSHILWVKDQDRTIVVNELTGNAYILVGKEAAIWSWLNLGYGYDSLVEFVANLLKLSILEARRNLRQMLEEWHKLDLLKMERVQDG